MKQQRELADVSKRRCTGSCVCVVYNHVLIRLLNQEPRSSSCRKVELAFIMASYMKIGGEKEKDDEISIQPESSQPAKEQLGNLALE